MPELPASEDAILARIDAFFPNSHQSLVLGRGDDCAIFKSDLHICASNDLFLEDVHFRASYFQPNEIGHKALAVNISDIAAMGARPVAFSLALGIPDWVDQAWLDSFFSGMADLAAQEGVALCGGDISRAASLTISITVFGNALPGRSLLLRGGAMPGDIIFTIGVPGLARIGFIELEKQGRKALETWPEACAAHLAPQPRTEAGLMLARAAYIARPPTLMDVSDGLARDLRRLLGHSETRRGLGADLKIPPALLHSEVLRHSNMYGEDPVKSAFAGGEDYILLGACAPDMEAALRAAIPDFHKIGAITRPGPIFLNAEDADAIAGFDHFGGRHGQ